MTSHTRLMHHLIFDFECNNGLIIISILMLLFLQSVKWLVYSKIFAACFSSVRNCVSHIYILRTLELVYCVIS